MSDLKTAGISTEKYTTEKRRVIEGKHSVSKLTSMLDDIDIDEDEELITRKQASMRKKGVKRVVDDEEDFTVEEEESKGGEDSFDEDDDFSSSVSSEKKPKKKKAPARKSGASNTSAGVKSNKSIVSQSNASDIKKRGSEITNNEERSFVDKEDEFIGGGF